MTHMNKFFQCRNACGDRFLTRTEREKHEMSHNDPALLDPEQREAIVKAREERAAVNAACTRRACTVAEAVSMDALAAQYPQVRRLIEANESVAKDLELRLEPTARLEAATARFMLECSERLRAALVGA